MTPTPPRDKDRDVLRALLVARRIAVLALLVAVALRGSRWDGLLAVAVVFMAFDTWFEKAR